MKTLINILTAFALLASISFAADAATINDINTKISLEKERLEGFKKQKAKWQEELANMNIKRKTYTVSTIKGFQEKYYKMTDNKEKAEYNAQLSKEAYDNYFSGTFEVESYGGLGQDTLTIYFKDVLNTNINELKSDKHKVHPHISIRAYINKEDAGKYPVGKKVSIKGFISDLSAHGVGISIRKHGGPESSRISRIAGCDYKIKEAEKNIAELEKQLK